MRLGLPDSIDACLFDLDGVLTQTAKVHAAAWKQMFDEYLRTRAEARGEEFRPFDARDDYDRYVDGKPRADGVRSFLESRGIKLPEGSADDPPDAETIAGLGNRKNALVLRLIDEHGVEAYEGSVRYVRAAIDAGLRRAVVSSSTNCRAVLRAAGIEDLFEEIVDGHVAEARGAGGQAGARHLPGRRREARGRAGRRGRLRGRPRRGRGGPRRRLRLRGRRRPGRAGRGACRARRRHRREGPRGAAALIRRGGYEVDPWEVRESSLDLELLAQSESVFALSNGHIGLRGNLDEGEPYGLPGTYLNGFYEGMPLPYAEAGYGYPESGQTVVNATNGKIIRLLVADEPFDVRYGRVQSHERVLDLRAGTLTRKAEWTSPTEDTVRVTTTRLVSFAQRAIAAIEYVVEPVDGPLRVVVQSELVANEPLPSGAREPTLRAARRCRRPLESERHGTQDAARDPRRTGRSRASCAWPPARST